MSNFQGKIFLQPKSNEYSIFDDFVHRARKLCDSQQKSYSKYKESSISISKQIKTEFQQDNQELTARKSIQHSLPKRDSYSDIKLASPFKFQLPLRLEQTLHYRTEKKRIPACLTSRRLKYNFDGLVQKSLHLEQLKSNNFKVGTADKEQETKFLITKYFLSKPLVCIKTKRKKKQQQQTELL